MTESDDLISPIFAKTARKQPDAPARGPAYGPGWTEADAAAARERTQDLVRQVLDRMPPPAVRAIPETSLATEERFEETDAFKRAVAALVEG